MNVLTLVIKHSIKKDLKKQQRQQEKISKDKLNIFKKKVINKSNIIVQGNFADDMVRWYSIIQDMLTDEHFKNVGGIAVADTCMGNKELESIDMLTAAHRIAQFANPSATEQIHLLGVGSIPRMAPVLYLEHSGFLKDYKKVSYAHLHCMFTLWIDEIKWYT